MTDFSEVERLLAERRPGCSLPQGLYNGQAAFDFDLAAIFSRSWLMVGLEAELPKPGSWLSLTLGPWPVLITRDRHFERIPQLLRM